MTGIEWATVWTDVAQHLRAHHGAGRGRLLTEDVMRMETILALQSAGVEPARLAIEVRLPELAGGSADLVIDPPAGTVIELKFPRDSRTGISPDTMTMGELLKDFIRVSACPAEDRWVVQVISSRLERYLVGVEVRHKLRWQTTVGAEFEIDPKVVDDLPKTALLAIGGAHAGMRVHAICRSAETIVYGLRLYAYQVHPADSPPAATDSTASPGVESKGQEAQAGHGSATEPVARPGVGSRQGARFEILAAARAIAARNPNGSFSMNEVVEEMHARGTGYADSTIRTMLSAHMCAESQGDGISGYADVTRIGTGLYRLT